MEYIDERREKTNAWIKQIISSNIVYPAPIIMGRVRVIIEEQRVYTAAAIIIPRITCPALMLAARRNERVTGRIIELRVSTEDRNLAMGDGVFSGRK